VTSFAMEDKSGESPPIQAGTEALMMGIIDDQIIAEKMGKTQNIFGFSWNLRGFSTCGVKISLFTENYPVGSKNLIPAFSAQKAPNCSSQI